MEKQPISILRSHYGYRKQREPKPKRSQRNSTSIVKFSLRFMCVISAKLFNPPCSTKNVIAPETSYFICYCMFFCRLIICLRAILSVYVHYIFLHSAIPSISISYYDFFYNITSPIQQSTFSQCEGAKQFQKKANNFHVLSKTKL